MNKKRTWLSVTLAVSVVILAACATTPANRTKVTGTWKDAQFNKKLSHILIVSLADEPGIRSKVENRFVRRLSVEGVRAAASSDLMPPEEKIDRQTVRAAMAGKDFDGVLVSRLIGVASDMTYVPPQPNTSFDTGLLRGVPMVTAPSRMEHRSVVSLQIDLYDPSGEGRLVWSLTSQSFNPDNVTEVIANVSEAIANDLKAKGLI